MTLMDHPQRGGRGAILRAAARQREQAGAKAEPDVADLLGVSSHDSSILPAISPGDEAANALLDVIAQDHFERATGSPAAAREKAAAAEPEEATGSLLQQEIDALLAGDAEATAAPEHPPSSDDFPEPVRAGEHSGDVSSDELAVLLPDAHQNDASDEADGLMARHPLASEKMEIETIAPDSAAEAVARELEEERLNAPLEADMDRISGDDDSAISDAEGVLAEELAALHPVTPEALATDAPGQPAAGVSDLAPGPSTGVTTAAAEAEAGGNTYDVDRRNRSAEAALPGVVPVPVIILQPDEEEEEAPPAGLLTRLRRTTGEVLLMGAQLIDLPFSWLNGMDKHVVGVVAVVFFLSGWLLVALGWWLSAR